MAHFITRYPGTWILCVVYIGFSAFVSIKSGSWWNYDEHVLIRYGINIDVFSLGAEPWRLLVSTIMHNGPIHLIMNLLGLVYFGAFVESKTSWWFVIVAHSIMGVFAGIASASVHHFGLSCGGSGALYGMAGMMAIGKFVKENGVLTYSKQAMSFSLIVVFSILSGFLFPIMDNAAHIGGFISGLILGLVYFFILHLFFHNFIQQKTTSLLIITVLTFAFFLISPKWKTEYYLFFKNYMSLDDQAEKLKKNGIYILNDSHEIGVEQARSLYEENYINSTFKTVADLSIVNDVMILNTRAKFNMKSAEFALKYYKTSSGIDLDSSIYYWSRASSLPPLNYYLEFKEPMKVVPPMVLQTIPFTQNYDSLWFPVNHDQPFSFFRFGQKDSVGRIQGWVYDYYKDSTMQMKAIYSNNLRFGFCAYYHPNGKHEAVGDYYQEGRIGWWEFFYQNGGLKSKIDFSSSGMYIESVFDSLGNSLVVNGSGLVTDIKLDGKYIDSGRVENGVKSGYWKGFYPNGGNVAFVEEYVNGKLAKGVFMDRDSMIYEYTEVYEPATPVMDMKTYETYLKENLMFPEMAIKNNVKGILVLDIYVDKNGRIINLEPITFLGSGCEEEAIRLVKNGPSFSPGKSRGKPESGRTQVAVNFGLIL